LDQGNHILSQKVLTNFVIDLFVYAKKYDRTFLAVAAHHSQQHLLQRSFKKGEMRMLGSTSATGRSAK
jgi:hypothetical protein